ncbi:tyrosine-protein phosphatase [Desulfovibrio sp. OttesenSCG-928-A18]|nr:tyrosine-protein phosphatase [Desulfovibrio sp. OttesenSCG-928-A18]
MDGKTRLSFACFGLCRFLLPVLLAFCCCACASSRPEPGAQPRPAQWAQPVQAPGADNLYQVDRGLYRAAQPNARGMRALEEHGIRTLLNLRSTDSDPPLARGTGLSLRHLPFKAHSIANEDNAVLILQAIRDAQKPLLVHCTHGADRTGFAIAMYRMVEQGWSREEALREMVQGDFGFHAMFSSIPAYIRQADLESIRSRLR